MSGFSQAVSDFVVAVGATLVLFFLLRIVVNRAKRSQEETKKQQYKKTRDGKIVRVSQFPRDAFFQSHGYSYDYVLAMPVYHKDKGFGGRSKVIQEEIKRFSVRRIAELVAAAGLQVKMEWSHDFKLVLMKIRAPMQRLMQEADRVNYRILLNPESLKRRLEKGVEGKWAPVFYDENKTDLAGLYKPFDYIYGPYDMRTDDGFQFLYQRHSPSFQVFRSADRIKLIVSILEAQATPLVKGAGLNLAKLQAHKVMDSHFPIHIVSELTAVQRPIMNITQLPWNMPFELIRAYFGEKIGLYFAWVSHYTSFMMAAAVAGFITWLDVVIEDDASAVLVPFFAVFMAVWATNFLEYWKRKEAVFRMQWGTEDYEEEEQPRPGFITNKNTSFIVSPVTRREVPWFPIKLRNAIFRYSGLCISIAIAIVLACVITFFYIKVLFVRNPWIVDGVDIGVYVPGIFNAVQIQIGNRLYGMLAIYLNDLENHRTDTEYEDYLIGKTFIFQFVNSYASLIYIAFIKDYVSDDPAIRCVDYDDDGEGDCMDELGVQLGTILILRLVLDNLIEIGVPAITRWYRNRGKDKRHSASSVPTKVADQARLEEYDVIMGTFDDYSEMVIQYGYTTMFVAAFPLAPVVSLISSWIELRVDGYKLCYLSRRPQPKGAEDIGTWQIILELIGFLACAINVGLFTFTGDFLFLRGTSPSTRFLVFIFMEHFLLITKYFIAIAVPDVPPPVKTQLQRQNYMISKVFENAEDEDDDDIASGIKGSPPDLSISVAVDPWEII